MSDDLSCDLDHMGGCQGGGGGPRPGGGNGGMGGVVPVHPSACTGRIRENGDIEMGYCSDSEMGYCSGSDINANVPNTYDCEVEQVAAPDMCYALVLSGGGNKGSYQAGVIKGLTEKYGGSLRWDVVAGVSVGALNAFTSRYFHPGDERAWADRLVDIWRNEVKQCDVSTCVMPLKKNIWKFGRQILSALIVKKPSPLGLCDNTPLLNLSKRIFSKNAPVYCQRGLAISAARLNDMQYVTFTDKRKGTDELMRAVMASAAVPGLFSPVEVDVSSGLYYYDGGLMSNANVASAVKRCMDMKGVTADKVVVDYLYTSPIKVKYMPIRPNKTSVFDLIDRAFHMLRREGGKENPLFKARGRFPGFHIRHYIAPTRMVFDTLLANVSMLDLSKRDVILRLIEEGIKDGKQAACYTRRRGI
eukprot:GHVS01080807.1.p1 GENE.GHVS01080807.1~~GHVS01080807.1.p1  ORF type:complete len:430 (-),score=65.91 GHVS01080807.1:113-1360(-)